MNQLIYSDNSSHDNVYQSNGYHETTYCVLFARNSNSNNNTIDLISMENSIISEWRLALNNVIITLQIISAILIFFGNLLVISAVVTTKELKRITDLYIVSLALADLLVAILLMPPFIIRQNVGHWPFKSPELCIYWLSFNVLLCTASILNLCCISVDRYIAINYPMKYISKRTRRTALYMIGGAWTFSFLVTLPPIFGMQHHAGVGNCSIRNDMGYRFLTGTTAFIIPFLLIGFIYVRIFWVIRQRSKEFAKGKFSADSKEHRHKSSDLIFSRNNIHIQHIARIKQCFSSCSFNRRRSFVLSDRQSNLCISYTPNKRHKMDKVNKHPCQSISSPILQERSVQSCPGKPCMEYENILLNPVTFDMHTDNTETYTSQSTDTKENKCNTDSHCIDDKTVNNSVSSQQKHPKYENEQAVTSQKNGSSQSKSKCSDEQKNRDFSRRERFTFTRERKTVKTVATVVCCFILCWLPYAVLHFVEGTYECLVSERLYMVLSWAAYLNSMCNPFIYAFCNKEYLTAFKRLLHIRRNV